MVQVDSDGYMTYPGYTRLPVIPGHEFSGEVVEIGTGVSGFAVGDAVTCDNMVWCGTCEACLSGSWNQCQRLEEIGFTLAGGLAEYAAVPARCCWKTNPLLERWGPELGFDASALVEPAAVAYQGIMIEGGGLSEGATVVVYGAGPIGQAAIALARAAGAGKVIVFQRSEARRRMAAALGADIVLDPEEIRRRGNHPRDAVMDLTEGRGAHLQVEAAGAFDQTVPEMLTSLAPRGKIILLGRSPHAVSLFLDPLLVSAARIIGSIGHAGAQAFPGVIDLMVGGRLNLLPMVTARIALQDVPAALTSGDGRSAGKTLVLLERGSEGGRP